MALFERKTDAVPKETVMVNFRATAEEIAIMDALAARWGLAGGRASVTRRALARLLEDPEIRGLAEKAVRDPGAAVQEASRAHAAENPPPPKRPVGRPRKVAVAAAPKKRGRPRKVGA